MQLERSRMVIDFIISWMILLQQNKRRREPREKMSAPYKYFFFSVRNGDSGRRSGERKGSGRRSGERKGRGSVVFGDQKQHWLRFDLHALLLCRMSPYCCSLMTSDLSSQSYLCPMQVQELQTCGLAVALSPRKMLGV